MSKETAFPVKKLIYLTDEQARMISEYRFDKRLNSENEAVRQLIDIGLDAAKRNNSQSE